MKQGEIWKHQWNDTVVEILEITKNDWVKFKYISGQYQDDNLFDEKSYVDKWNHMEKVGIPRFNFVKSYIKES